MHSCIEAHIDDSFPISVDIKQPCCCNLVNIWEKEYYCKINIDSIDTEYRIEDPFDWTADIQDTSVITIMLEWVCGTGYAEYYLRIAPTDVQWITIEYDVEYYVRSNTNWIVQ